MKDVQTRIVVGGLVTSFFVVLAMQPVRFDAFEGEKAGLLIVVGVLLLVSGHLRIPRHLVMWTALGLVGVSLLSTVSSLNPSVSLWPTGTRADVFLLLAVGVIIMARSAQTPEWTRYIVPSLLMSAIPLFIFNVTVLLEIDPTLYNPGAFYRLGSLTGNANWLSSWTVFSLLLVGPYVWRACRTDSRWQIYLLYGLPLALMVGNLIITRSRGALIALVVGGALVVSLVAARTRQQTGVVRLGGVGAFVLAAVLVAGFFITGGREETNFGRLVRFEDPFREATWSGMQGIFAEWTIPLDPPLTERGDQLAGLRPIIGYGPNTQLYIMERLPEEQQAALVGLVVDRIHNQTYDTLITLGVAGTLAWLALYEVALYTGLKLLGLLPHRGRWLMAQAVGVVVGGGGVLLIAPWLLPAGIVLGALAGTIGYVLLLPTPDAPPLTECDLLVVGIMGMVAAFWVDHQFGFLHASILPLWWGGLGLLMAFETAEPERISGHVWRHTGMIAGLFTLFSLGLTVDSRLIGQPGGSIVLQVLILIAVAAYAAWGERLMSRTRRLDPLALVTMGGVWAAFFILEALLRGVGSALLDTALANEMPPSQLQAAAYVLALPGVALIIGSISLIALPLKRLDGRRMVAMLLALLVGGVIYARGYAYGSLHKTAYLFDRTNDPAVNELASSLYGSAVEVAPREPLAYLNWLEHLADYDRVRGRQLADELWQADPYITLTDRWERLFEE